MKFFNFLFFYGGVLICLNIYLGIGIDFRTDNKPKVIPLLWFAPTFGLLPLNFYISFSDCVYIVYICNWFRHFVLIVHEILKFLIQPPLSCCLLTACMNCQGVSPCLFLARFRGIFTLLCVASFVGCVQFIYNLQVSLFILFFYFLLSISENLGRKGLCSKANK